MVPDQILQMPTFHDGAFQDVAYQLNSFVLNLGGAPTIGHYVTVALDADRFLLTDDNRAVRELEVSEQEWSHRNPYLFFYNRTDSHASS